MRYFRQKLRLTKRDFKQQLEARVAGRLGLMWHIRVAFAPPQLALRALSALCRDFATNSAPVISYEYVSRVRDAFAEIVKKLNRQQISESVASAPQEPLIILHVHDEAAMRLRSYQQEMPDVADAVFVQRGRPRARGRSSKVQHNVVQVLHEGKPMDVYFELQAVRRKDAQTLARALRQVVEYVAAAALDQRDRGTRLRIVHLLTGDGVPTNMAAARTACKHAFVRCMRVAWS